VKFNTHLHVEPRLRKRGAVPPISTYGFMAWYLIKQRIRLHNMILS